MGLLKVVAAHVQKDETEHYSRRLPVLVRSMACGKGGGPSS
jgi:hypothetical protein